MKALLKKWIQRIGGQSSRAAVETELRFHLEALEEDLLRTGVAAGAARAVARERFGDIERVTRECVNISRRQNPLKRGLKSLLVLVFVIGLLLRIFSAVPQFIRIGDLSMTIGIFGHAFLYVRGLLPANFRWHGASSSSLSGKPAS
jgi:hypothetical protein